jgi:hypothetical protein
MDVDFPQNLEIVLSPPNFHNRLFIYTGTAFGVFPDLGPNETDDWSTETILVDLTKWHGGRVFNPVTTIAIASASLAAINGSDDAGDSTWAVNKSWAEIVSGDPFTPAGTLHLRAALALRGAGNLIWRLAYQVFIQTIGFNVLPLGMGGLAVMASGLTAITIPRGGSGAFILTGSIDTTPATPEPIAVMSDALTPNPVYVAAGSTTFAIPVTIPTGSLEVGTWPISTVASGPLNSQKFVVMVTQQ